ITSEPPTPVNHGALLEARPRSAPPPSSLRPQRDRELAAIAAAAAETLRRDGPMHGASVVVMPRARGRSQPQALAVVSFALPTGILMRGPPPSTLLRGPGVGRRGTVLVVDDDFDLRQTLREILQDEGYAVDTAANGQEALDRMRRETPPEVVVLDLM